LASFLAVQAMSIKRAVFKDMEFEGSIMLAAALMPVRSAELISDQGLLTTRPP
jgi:hypothetical protein